MARSPDRATSFLRSPLTWTVAGLRLALILGALHPLLNDDGQRWFSSMQIPLESVLINPVYTLQHVREATAIRRLSSASNQFEGAYAGGRVHLPPLMLATAESILNHIPAEWDPSVLVALLVMLLDLWIARLLERLAHNLLFRPDNQHEAAVMEHMDDKIQPNLVRIFPVTADDSKSLFRFSSLPFFISQMYYASPITIAAATTGCFQNLRVWFLLQALVGASSNPQGSSTVWTALALALATYLDIHCYVFMVPVALLNNGNLAGGVLFDTFTVILQGLSLALVGSNAYFTTFTRTHLSTFQLKSLQPCLSTLWYLRMQVFLRFRLYFTILLAGLPFLVIAPTTIRLYNYPDVLVAILWFIGVIFRPPSTLYDLNVAFAFMFLNPRSLSRLKPVPSIIALGALPIPVILYMVSYWMWLEHNGEANFLFFQCLAYGIFCSVLFLNFCAASIRRDKALRLTEASQDALVAVSR